MGCEFAGILFLAIGFLFMACILKQILFSKINVFLKSPGSEQNVAKAISNRVPLKLMTF